MKILQLLEAAATGAGRHVADLIDGLLARGHEVHLLYSPLRSDHVFAADLQRLKERRNFHSAPVPMAHYPGASDVRATAILRRYLRRCGPFDLVHCHSTKAGFIARLGLIGRSVKRLYTPHGFLSMDPAQGRVMARVAGGLERILAALCVGMVVVSREEYLHAVELGISSGKLRLIPNGVVLLHSGGLEKQRSVCRSDWGLREDVCIGFVGRFTPVKAPDVMLHSYAAFRKRSRVPSRLVMVGDGPLAVSLRGLAAELGIGDQVIWLGAQDARPLMPGFDVLALTSKSEGHPLVILEAMARGLPIVAPRVGGIADTVQAGVNGFIAPPGDAGAIADALEKLASNPVLRARMGEASRAMSGHFSADRMVEHTLAFYEEIVTGVFAGTNNSLSKAAASG
ncbi:MAG TPA: glycosyltransferase [Bryobacteraceae bacterium]|nr:glycosyltransferase [Bryobacteraceae bacterium]